MPSHAARPSTRLRRSRQYTMLHLALISFTLSLITKHVAVDRATPTRTTRSTGLSENYWQSGAIRRPPFLP
ncbi:MAG: hypothetical protein JWR46_1736 [Mycobacterium sp.]|jgi:hypothetical protein|nr:hypothetical protein [Mycobacterium sp.]MCW2729418.1 hypothetical protein [Mycobacterium sp.]MDT5313571.1 hypothetical protein [Mycobacterium sp.]